MAGRTARVLLAVLLAATVSLPVASIPATGAESATLAVSGKGYGHGRGMSQYGAQGAALDGLSAAQILGFYYPGTTTSTTSGYVRVWTTADTSPGVYVRPATGLRARSLVTNTAWTLPVSSTITSWILAPYGEHQTQLKYYRSSTRTWVVWKTLAGMGQFEGTSEGFVVTMVLPDGTLVPYRGRLRTADRAGTDLDTINVVTIEYYLRGVLPKEVITSWRPPALQAQAVAARTYAASKRLHPNGSDYDLCDIVLCQVYAGSAAEVTTTTNAVVATANQIRTYCGVPILAEFSSSNGGFTAPGGVAYLPAKPDPYDAYPGNGNPNSTWTTSIDAVTAGQRLGVGTLEELTVLQRDGYGSWGGRVVSARVRGTTATKTMTGDQVRFGLGLKSAYVLFTGP